jgi:hypothetical protein
MRIPTAAQYKKAFLAIRGKMHPKHFEMLRASYDASDHTISVKELARTVGYKQAQQVYGRLGRLLCDELGFRPTMTANGKPVVTQVLAEAPNERSQESWEWTLRPQVAKALEQLGWVRIEANSHSYVLTWNPEKEFPWDDPKDNVDWYIRQTEKGKQPQYIWSTGNTKSICPGDRLYLFRQGRKRGIVGAGYATSEVFSGRKGQRKLLVELRFDAVVPSDQMLPIKTLQAEQLGVNWGWLPASGIGVPDESAARLEQLWLTHLVRIGRSANEQELFSRVERDAFISSDESNEGIRRVLRQIVQRRGQPAFREQLLEAYGGRCAVTGCNAQAALEAAHIEPYSGPSSNCVSNGLLLRSDIHTLFDLGLIAISPDKLTVAVDPELVGTEYDDIAGQAIRLPKSARHRPDSSLLRQRWKEFKKRNR